MFKNLQKIFGRTGLRCDAEVHTGTGQVLAEMHFSSAQSSKRSGWTIALFQSAYPCHGIEPDIDSIIHVLYRIDGLTGWQTNDLHLNRSYRRKLFVPRVWPLLFWSSLIGGKQTVHTNEVGQRNWGIVIVGK